MAEPMLCPVDRTPLVMSERQSIEIDYCPTCRGVWLDRGELEKLMAAGRTEPDYGAQPAPPPRPQAPPPGYGQPAYGYGERGEHGEWGERGEHGYYGHRKKRFDIFDIFD